MMSPRRKQMSAREVAELHMQVAQARDYQLRSATPRHSRPEIGPENRPGLFLVKSGTKMPERAAAAVQRYGRPELVTRNNEGKAAEAETAEAAQGRPNGRRWLFLGVTATGPMLWLGHELLVVLKLI